MEKLGINTRALLYAVHGHYGRTVDISAITPNIPFLTSLSINQLNYLGVFHSAEATGEHDQEVCDVFKGLTYENPADLQNELDKRVDKARDARLRQPHMSCSRIIEF